MNKIWLVVLIELIIILLVMIYYSITKEKVYDKLNFVFATNTIIILGILMIGCVDGRIDMYVDIALGYSILGFVTSVILAKYIGGKRK